MQRLPQRDDMGQRPDIGGSARRRADRVAHAAARLSRPVQRRGRAGRRRSPEAHAINAHVVCRKPDTNRGAGGIDLCAPRERQRRQEFRADDRDALVHEVDLHEASSLFEHEANRGRIAGRNSPAGNEEGGPDVGVAREGHFALGGEDAHVRGVSGVLRRQNKSGFDLIELDGKRLHLRIRQTLGVEHDRDRVAA
jgi:hypothetical protein